MSRGGLLICLEDPGAANFIAPALDELAAAGWDITLSAAGPAFRFLTDRGITAHEHDDTRDPTAFLQDTETRFVMVGTSENPETFTFGLTAAARASGLPSIGFVDGPANAEHRFRGRGDNPLAHLTDWLILDDDFTARAFAALGCPHEHMFVTGHPYHDVIRELAAEYHDRSMTEHRRATIGDVPAARPVIVFLGEGSDGLGMDIKRRSPDYTLSGHSGSARRTEIVLEEFLDAVDTLDKDPYLVFRAHPKDPASGYSAYMERFDHISEHGQPLQLLFGADLVVGLSTSLLAEAALAGLNTLSILPTEKQKYLIPTVLQGLTPCATDRTSLRRLLPEALHAGVRQPVHGEADDATPASTRLVEALDKIAGHH